MSKLDPLKLVVLLQDAVSPDHAYTAALEARGFQAVTVSSADAAVQIANDLHPVAVLVDVEVTAQSSADAVHRLRRETNVPILCLIGTAAGHQESGAVEGCDLKLHRTGEPSRDLAPLFDALRA